MGHMPIWICEINSGNNSLELLGIDFPEGGKLKVKEMKDFGFPVFLIARSYSEEYLRAYLGETICNSWQYLDFVGQFVDESPIEGLFNEGIADPVSELLILSKEKENQMPALVISGKDGVLIEKLIFVSEESRDFLFDRMTDFYAQDRFVPPFDTNGSPLNWAHWWDEQDFLDLESGGTGEVKESPEPSVVIF